MLTIDNLHVRYAGAAHETLRGVSAQISGHTALTGPSGSGKSTLVLAAAGLLRTLRHVETSGTIRLGAADLAAYRPATLAEYIGVVTRNADAQIVGRTVAKDTEFGPRNLCCPVDEVHRRRAWALDAVGLTGLDDHPTAELSGGQRQRLVIAGVLAMRPDVLLLDDACAHLDPVGTTQISQIIDTLGTDVLVVSHDPAQLDRAEQLYILDHGTITWNGRPADATSPPGVRRRHHPAPLPTPGDIAITMRQVHFAYHERDVLRDANFTARSGELVAITGANGSGKTTFLKLLAGLLRPRTGTISIAGEDIADIAAWKLADRVGSCFQNPDHQLFNRTLATEVGYGLRNSTRFVADALDFVGLTQHAHTNPISLPSFQRRLAALATAIVRRPGVVLVDEPTAGCDDAQAQTIMNLLVSLCHGGVCVVMVSHDQAAIDQATRAVSIIDGTVEEAS